MSMRNYNENIGNRTRDLPTCSAVPQPTAPPAACPTCITKLMSLGVSRGPGSVVGIATGYGLDGPGIEPRWGRDFPHLFRPALGPTQPPVQ